MGRRKATYPVDSQWQRHSIRINAAASPYLIMQRACVWLQRYAEKQFTMADFLTDFRRATICAYA